MRVRIFAGVLAGSMIAILGAGNAAYAAQARPWLCRDKPVFSADKPMTFDVTGKSEVEWRIFFMQYEPDAAHDGFDIVASKEVGSNDMSKTGKLPAGRYFTVAMRRIGGGHWVCHSYSRVQPMPQGSVANICYGISAPNCPITLTVKLDSSVAASVVPVPEP